MPAEALLSHAGMIGPFLLAIATGTTLALSRRAPVVEGQAAAMAQPGAKTRVVMLGGHLLAFAAVWFLSGALFGDGRTSAGVIAAWVTAAVTAAALLAGFVLPFRAWPVLWRTARLPLGVGLLAGAAAWGAGVGSLGMWDRLGGATVRAVAALVGLFTGGDVMLEAGERLVGTRSFQVIVAPICSGYEGVGLVTVFLTLFLFRARHELHLGRAALLIPIGVVAALGANVLRIAGLIAVGTTVSAEIAYGAFHSKAGWVLSCALALGLAFWARRSPLFSRQPVSSAHLLDHPTAAYLMPFLAVLATALATGLFARTGDLAYGARVLVGLAVLCAYRRHHPCARLTVSATAVGIGLLVALVFAGLSPAPDPAFEEAARRQWSALPPAPRLGWTLLRIVGAVAIIPVVEELAFRGYLLRRLVTPEFETLPPAGYRLWAVVVSSLAFGAVHGAFLAGAASGALLAAALWWRGRLGDAILAHAVANAALLIHAAVIGRSPFTW